LEVRVDMDVLTAKKYWFMRPIFSVTGLSAVSSMLPLRLLNFGELMSSSAATSPEASEDRLMLIGTKQDNFLLGEVNSRKNSITA